MLDKGRIRTFVVGGVAGVVAGILLAPRSGKELRGSIASRAGEARERGRESYFDARERARERLSEVRDLSPRTEEPATPEDAVAPELAPRPPEPPLDLGGPAEEPSPGPPPLRDVSLGSPGDPAGPRDRSEDPEELRRRIRETLSRLRDRLDGPRGFSGKEDG